MRKTSATRNVLAASLAMAGAWAQTTATTASATPAPTATTQTAVVRGFGDGVESVVYDSITNCLWAIAQHSNILAKLSPARPGPSPAGAAATTSPSTVPADTTTPTGITIVGTYATGNHPVGLAAGKSAAGASVIAVGNLADNTVGLYNGSDGTLITTVKVGSEPGNITFDAALGCFMVSNRGEGSLTKLSPSGAVLATIPAVGTRPMGGVALADGTYYVAAQKSDTVAKISTGGVVLSVLNLGANTGPTALCSDGTYIYSANFYTKSVSKINASSGALVATFATNDGPAAILCSGGTLILSNNGANTVQTLNSLDGSLVSTKAVGYSPWGIALDSLNRLWVANNGSDSVTAP